MAIDNAEKRKNISGILLLLPGVTPNSSKDQEWRQQSGWSYSGILAGVPILLDTDPSRIAYIKGDSSNRHSNIEGSSNNRDIYAKGQ